MSVVKGNIQEDFFEQNSELTILPNIKQLRIDKGDEVASKILWAIYLIEDPQSSFYRIPREERIEEVKREYFDINLEDYQELLNEYCRFILTKEQAMLKFYFDLMDKLVIRLKSLNPERDKDLDNAIRILERVPKIWEGLEKIKKNMKEEDGRTQIKGNAREGAREQRRRKANKDIKK